MITDEIKAYLITQGAVSDAECFRNVMPETPDAIVSITEYPGGAIEGAMTRTTPVFERAMFQVVCRGTRNDPDAARLKAAGVFAVIDIMKGGTLGSVKYLGIVAQQSPFFMGRDANERPMFACNYMAYKELSTA